MVVCGWVLFRSDTLAAAGRHLSAMFGFGGSVADEPSVFWWREIATVLVVAAIGSLPIAKGVKKNRVAVVAGGLAQAALFAVSVSCLVMRSHNPFIYFNF